MFNLVRIWILLSTLLVAAGWILSALHQLNGIGYTVFFILAVLAVIFWQRKTKWQPKQFAQKFSKLRHRFKRSAPLIFLALTLMTLLEGMWYAPSNGSSTAYRIPRVMHWLSEGHWHWIRTLDVRINIAGCGFEWLFAPLILLTHTDRFLFLVNWLPFLLLPGLIYGVFTRLGVRARVAWWWMWLLPSGWCFIMQAGSTINDCFATAYALATVDFALRARENKKVSDLWLALLAAALVTGVKQTDILLAIPGLIAIWPSARLLLKRPLSSAAITAVCLLVSALPMMIFNVRHTGNWAGVPADSTWEKAELHSPVWGVIGNTFCLTVQNLKPPVFPFVNSWNAAMHHFLQTPFGAHFAQFETFGRLSFGAAESTAALGAGISFLILISIFASRYYQQNTKNAAGEKYGRPLLRILRWTPWAMLLVFMAKVGTFENGRQLASYYFLLFPLLLMSPGQSVLVRQRWWRLLALLVMAVAGMLVFTSRDRPLFPAQTILDRLEAKFPNSKFISHVADTYTEAPAYEKERKFFAEYLPTDATVLGYATISRETEAALWLPYGCRRVEVILPDDTPEELRAAGIEYAVVCQEKFLQKTGLTIDQWLAHYNGILLWRKEFLEDPYEPAETYYLIRLPNS